MNETKLWNAVLARDRRYDGDFVYGVQSTGVYCRPSCPSRRPRRPQVVFFARPATAEQAGFRACKRCRPQLAAGDPQAPLVRRLCRYIETRVQQDGRVTLDDIARQAGLSPFHVQRVFKRLMGLSPRQYAEARRLDALKAHLKKKGETVTTAMYQAGYGSSRGLYERAHEKMGMTPATYRRGGEGMQIEYTVADCPLGRLMVAATSRGVCFVSLGDADKPLVHALHEEYPKAEIHAGKRLGWVRDLLTYLEGGRHPDVPLDLQATAFQMRVWKELQAIPLGATRTYSEVARKMGRPTATRAVAHACATNPVSLVVPCHRVVGTDGGLHGYRWGLDRKRALIESEKSKAAVLQ